MITHARLLELLRYEPETGEFIWLTGKRAGQPAGKPVGSRPFKGRNGWTINYWGISIGGRTHFRAKLAWFYMTGAYPEHQVDHHDVDPQNDRWSNLRAATQALNNANRRAFSNNKTGIKGVHFRADVGKFRAMISIDGRNKSLGYFENAEEAAAVYAQHAIAAFGDFARL